MIKIRTLDIFMLSKLSQRKFLSSSETFYRKYLFSTSSNFRCHEIVLTLREQFINNVISLNYDIFPPQAWRMNHGLLPQTNCFPSLFCTTTTTIWRRKVFPRKQNLKILMRIIFQLRQINFVLIRCSFSPAHDRTIYWSQPRVQYVVFWEIKLVLASKSRQSVHKLFKTCQ